MAVKLVVRFLGTPEIFKDGEEVFFSYNKVNALVYYILVRGTVMRDELSGILWADKPDAVARKNLRNAIYEAKKYWVPIRLFHRVKQLLKSIRPLRLKLTARYSKQIR